MIAMKMETLNRCPSCASGSAVYFRRLPCSVFRVSIRLEKGGGQSTLFRIPITEHATRLAKAFTLIELLVVIAIIALLAALIFPVTGAVNRNKIRSRTRVEMAQIQTAIDSYKAKLGHYPPDNPTNVTINQLYYELAGTTANAQSTTYTTLDGGATITTRNIQGAFHVGGFVNAIRGAGSDEAAPAVAFIKALKTDQIGILVHPNSNEEIARILIGYPWKKTSNPPFNVDPIVGAPGLNPWRYRNHTDTLHPTLNNPDSYDLWIDINISGTVYRICNWSQQPLKVTTSLDN